MRRAREARLVHQARDRKAAEVFEFDELGHAGGGELSAGDVAAGVDPIAHDFGLDAEQVGQERVHVLFELAEMAGPLGGLGEADVFFALPAHGVKEHHAKGRDNSSHTGGEGPERGRGAFAGDDAGRSDAAELDEGHQGDGAIGAAAGRIEVDGAFAARLDAQEAIGEFGFAVGQIADDGDFDEFIFSGVRSSAHFRLLSPIEVFAPENQKPTENGRPPHPADMPLILGKR